MLWLAGLRPGCSGGLVRCGAFGGDRVYSGGGVGGGGSGSGGGGCRWLLLLVGVCLPPVVPCACSRRTVADHPGTGTPLCRGGMPSVGLPPASWAAACWFAASSCSCVGG